MDTVTQDVGAGVDRRARALGMRHVGIAAMVLARAAAREAGLEARGAAVPRVIEAFVSTFDNDTTIAEIREALALGYQVGTRDGAAW